MNEPLVKAVDEKFCSECGAIIKAKAEICPKCCVRQFTFIPQNAKNKTVAALFALILGSFGIHKFYLGHVGLGFLYLIFWWTWIPAIIGVVEGIILLTMSDNDFNNKYNINKMY